MILRRYVKGRFGQVHLRESGASSGTVPLVCLHATAYSSRSFEAIMQVTAGDRHVIALDLPGYGESDPPACPLDIAGYAQAIGEAVLAAVGSDPVELFGYHTGVVIAAEVALGRFANTSGLTFLGVPFFQVLDFDAWKSKLACRHELGDRLDQFQERWDTLVTKRPQGLSLRRGFENFVDELKAWPRGSEAHHALFAYDLPSRFRQIDRPVTILNPTGHLAGPSRAAAALIPGARLVELPELHGAVLDIHADVIARFISNGEQSPNSRSIEDTRAADRSIPAG